MSEKSVEQQTPSLKNKENDQYHNIYVNYLLILESVIINYFITNIDKKSVYP